MPKKTAPPPEEWITPQEGAALVDYHPEYIRRLARNGKIKSRKFSTVWQVERYTLLAYVKASEEHGAKSGPKPKA